MGPLRLLPRPVARVWGGRRLAETFGRALPEGPVGESWEVWGELEVAGHGATLDELYGGSFPVLMKWLDCNDWLSVQVHPDDALASRRGSRGKTECWFVREAAPEAEIIHGLRPGSSPEDLRPDATILEHLGRVKARAGDVFVTPAGTLHALGPGLLIYEIQQSSDLTYRLYDWGRDRETHWEESLEVLRTVRPEPHGPGPVRTPFFHVDELRGARAWEPGGWEVLTAFRGPAALEWSGGEERLAEGEARVLPAGLGPIRVTGDHLLRTRLIGGS